MSRLFHARVSGAVMRHLIAAPLVAFALVAVAALPARAAVDIEAVTAQNGVTAWLVEDDTLPMITVQFSFAGGAAQEPDGKAGMADLMAGLFDEGAGDMDAQAFQKRLDELGAEMSFNSGDDRIYGHIRMLSENSEAVFELLRLALSEPRFDPEPVERIRGQLLTRIRSDQRDPRQKGRDRMAEAVFGDHPYGRTSQDRLKGLPTVTPEDLKAFHARLFARSNLTVGVVGAIDAERLSGVLDTVFGDLPQEADLVPVADVTPRLDREVRVDYPMPQSTLRMVYPGIARDDPQFYAAYLMNTVLGGGNMSSRLFEEVREKRGLSYYAGSGLAHRDHAQMLTIETAPSAAQTDEARAVIEEVVETMRTEGVSEEELAAAKRYVIGAYAINNLDSARAIAGTLVNIQEHDLGIDYMERRTELIDAVTPEAVRAAARRLLSDAPAVLIVGPENAGADAEEASDG